MRVLLPLSALLVGALVFLCRDSITFGISGLASASALSSSSAEPAREAVGQVEREATSSEPDGMPTPGSAIPLLQSGGAPIEWTGRNPAAHRAKLVEINPVLLSADDTVLEVGDVLELELFDGQVFRSRVTQQKRWGREQATFTATARSDENAHSFLVLSAHDGVVRVAVEDATARRDYQLRYDPVRGRHVLLEIDETRTELYGCGHTSHEHGHHAGDGGVSHDSLGPEADRTAGDETASGVEADATDADSAVDDVILDVLIAYTPAALATQGSQANMEVHLSQSVALANIVHANSDTSVQLNLVHSVEVDYEESGDAEDDLGAIRFDDGEMDEVLRLRDYYAADFVSLFIDTTQVGGLAWRPDEYDSPEQAFSLVRVQQSDSTTSYTTAHEIAHNMGVGHSKTQARGEYDGHGVASYAAGWQWADPTVAGEGMIGRCSVMTYSDHDGDGTRDHERVPHFSNPEIDYADYGTGDAVDGDAARTIREGRLIFERFRCLPDYPVFDSFPYEYGFEPGEANRAWLQYDLDDMDWTLGQVGETPSEGTGPTGAGRGEAYAYVEASNNFDNECILAAEFDLSSMSAPELSFDYHMFATYAPYMGDLYLEASSDGGFEWTQLFAISGNQGNVWQNAEVDLRDYAGDSVLLRFRAVVGYGYRSDIALDGIRLANQPSGDEVETFGIWIEGFGTLDDPSPAGDPDGDGLSNFLEYAFGSLPDDAESTAAPSCELDAEVKTMTFCFVRARSGLEYRLESVVAMHLWPNPEIEWTSAYPNPENPLVAVGEEQTVTVDASGPQLFLKLKVEPAP